MKQQSSTTPGRQDFPPIVRWFPAHYPSDKRQQKKNITKTHSINMDGNKLRGRQGGEASSAKVPDYLCILCTRLAQHPAPTKRCKSLETQKSSFSQQGLNETSTSCRWRRRRRRRLGGIGLCSKVPNLNGSRAPHALHPCNKNGTRPYAAERNALNSPHTHFSSKPRPDKQGSTATSVHVPTDPGIQLPPPQPTTPLGRFVAAQSTKKLKFFAVSTPTTNRSFG